ncbi:MAG: CoA ester lyase [Proteobacteria bacterium]|nr:CoA ester lyase [Pseudomonadota bacterium]HQR04404.1 CoA ester lyase [Rhodocyclaceae bacterium]
MARSYLFVPGNQPARFDKAAASGADAIILDLEDSVPVSEKAAAREAVIAWMSATSSPVPVWIRTQGLDAPGFADDLATVGRARPRGLLLPKCEGAADVLRLGVVLDTLEHEHGLPEGSLEILVVATETPRAVQCMASFERPLPRLRGLMWGAEDLAAALGVRSLRDKSGQYLPPALRARDATLLAAAACGADPIDAVFVGIRDAAGLAAETRQHAAMGFIAKAAIHPAQIPVIHAALAPNANDVDWARAVITTLEDGARSTGVVDGSMVDTPHLIAARRILERM